MSSAKSGSSHTKYEIRKRDPNPKSCALLVIDMQNHFSAMATPILPNLNTTVSLCREASMPVIFTRHLDDPASGYRMIDEWWFSDLIIDGTPEAELMPGLACNIGDDMVIKKNTYSAFRKTGLEEKLLKMGVEEVIVTGVMTNLCCETTARDAFIRGFRVFFSTDATATSDRDLHDATLKNMAYGFAYLVDCHRLKPSLRIDEQINLSDER